jgi:hypothetical protein
MLDVYLHIMTANGLVAAGASLPVTRTGEDPGVRIVRQNTPQDARPDQVA